MEATTTSPKGLRPKRRLLLFLVMYSLVIAMTVMWSIGHVGNRVPSPLVTSSRTLATNSTAKTSTTVVGQGWTVGNTSGQGANAARGTPTRSMATKNVPESPMNTTSTIARQGETTATVAGQGAHAVNGTIAIVATSTVVVGQDRTTGTDSAQAARGAIGTLTTSTVRTTAIMNTTVVGRRETTGTVSGQGAHATNGTPVQSTKSLRYDLKWYNKSLFNESVNASHHIWFIETSNRRKLSAREACSVESACRHNGDFTVHLLSTGNISSSDCPYHGVLSKIPNFRSSAINASAILAGTPLASIQANGGALSQSRYASEHLSDFLRFVLLWIHGGAYVDLDVIVMKSLEGIRNTVFYESDNYKGYLASTVLFFDKHHPALGAMIDECARRYDPAKWTIAGPQVVSTLVSDAVFSRMVNIASSSAFLPVYYPGWKSLFIPAHASDVLKRINGSYGVHFWNSMSKGTRVVPGSGCGLDLLARAHCPSVYKLASSDGDL